MLQEVRRAGYIDMAVTRHTASGPTGCEDRIAQEWPVALVFNGTSHAVMMATPQDLEPMAVGFAMTEGLVASRQEILDVEVVLHGQSVEVQLTVSSRAHRELRLRRRSLSGRTGCGVCGIESLELLDLTPERVSCPPARPDIASIARAATELPRFQTLSRLTGALHAAAWCDPSGEVLMAVEDVGRHNALDKLVGQRVMQRLPLDQGFVFLSSRASYELVRKAARVGIPMLATVSAPTSLAIKIAREAGIALASFCRSGGFVEYTDPSQPALTSCQRLW
jgi:FdhD protein